jgi:uncharacterized protein YdaU (DUF1376 family)
MNFFKLYIGDYQRDTAHLSIAEHGAYMLMLQHYYATEKPLPIGKALHRMLRAQDRVERDAIDAVAKQFWLDTPSGLVNGRADAEITKADAQADTNGRIAREREAKRKAERKPDEQSTNRATNDQPNQTPDTRQKSGIHSEDKSSGGRPPNGEPPTTRESVFATGVALITAAGVQEKNARSMLAMLCKRHGEEAVSAAISVTAEAHPGDPVSWLQTVLKPKPVLAISRLNPVSAPAWEGAK